MLLGQGWASSNLRWTPYLQQLQRLKVSEHKQILSRVLTFFIFLSLGQNLACASCKKNCIYAAVQCSICKDHRHIECLRVPLKFLFAAGSQAFSFAKDFEFAQ